MKRIATHQAGIQQGSHVLFSDYENDGVMWAGTGPRATRFAVTFNHPYRSTPSVMVGISMWDLDQKTNQRADISADKITETGFEIVFKTWGDTRVARIRADWMAIGEMPNDDDWDLY